jgi:hypothetical protein
MLYREISRTHRFNDGSPAFLLGVIKLPPNQKDEPSQKLKVRPVVWPPVTYRAALLYCLLCIYRGFTRLKKHPANRQYEEKDDECGNAARGGRHDHLTDVVCSRTHQSAVEEIEALPAVILLALGGNCGRPVAPVGIEPGDHRCHRAGSRRADNDGKHTRTFHHILPDQIDRLVLF